MSERPDLARMRLDEAGNSRAFLNFLAVGCLCVTVIGVAGQLADAIKYQACIAHHTPAECEGE